MGSYTQSAELLRVDVEVAEAPITTTGDKTSLWWDLARSLSLANLCYLKIWRTLIFNNGLDNFLMKQPPLVIHYWAAILNVALLASVLMTALALLPRLFGRTGHRLGQWLFLAVFLVGANTFRILLFSAFPQIKSWMISVVGNWGWLAAHGVGLAAAIGMLVFARKRILSIVSTFLVLLSPLAPVTIGRAAYVSFSKDPARYAEAQLAPKLVMGPNAPRVLWIVFDEWDYRLTFVDRNTDLPLPEIDRFSAQSLQAKNALPPASQTILSMPAMIIGRAVKAVEARRPDDLLVTFSGSREGVSWRQQPNVFSRARQLGYNSAVLGWYIPYCRVLGRDLAECKTFEFGLYNGQIAPSIMGDSLSEVLPIQERSLLESAQFSPFLRSLSTEQHAKTYEAMRLDSLSLITDPSLGLIMIHLPIPHRPYFFDRETGRVHDRPLRAGYLDALALVDRTLGEIRQTLEAAGLWQGTTVLLTADHYYRNAKTIDGKEDHRVPFLLKCPNQTNAMVHSGQFQTTVTADLIIAMVQGTIVSPQDANSWLESHR